MKSLDPKLAEGMRLFNEAKMRPDQINNDDRQEIFELGRGVHLAFEIGTYLGASAECLLAGMPLGGMLVTIDTFEGTPGDVTGETEIPKDLMLDIARLRLSRFGPRVQIIRGSSPEIASLFGDGIADLVFIDGGHDYQSVMWDIVAWLPKLRPTGILAGHDYDKACDLVRESDRKEFEHRSEYLYWQGHHYGVVRAVNECFSRHETAKRPGSSIWWARPEWRAG